MTDRAIYQGVALANRRIRRVFRSWSRIFFSISASVSVSMNGDHCSASAGGRNGTSTVDRGASLSVRKKITFNYTKISQLNSFLYSSIVEFGIYLFPYWLITLIASSYL